MPHDLIDPRLVARAQLGDARSLDRLLRVSQDRLFLHVASIVGDHDASRDTLQRVLLIVAKKLSSLADPRLFLAWAYRIATREAVRDATVARRRELAHDGDAALEQVLAEGTEPQFDPDLIASVPAMIESLPPAARLVIRMHFVDGLRLIEIAEALEVPMGTVKSRLNYGLVQLRRLARR